MVTEDIDKIKKNKPGRNDPCPCGSGKKFKKCCQNKPASIPAKKDVYSQGSTPDPATMNHMVSLLNSGNYDEVKKQTRQLLAKYPDWGWGWKMLGTALQKEGQDGTKELQRAVELDPSDAEAYNNLGAMQRDLGQIDVSIQNLHKALAIRPDFAFAHNNLGIAFNALGRFDAARKCFSQALKLHPNFAEAHNNLGNTFKGLDQLDEATRSFRQAIALNPRYAEAYNNLGNTLFQQGNFTEGEACLRRALEIRPDYAQAHFNLGTALQEQGQLSVARECYHRALQIAPSFADAYNNLGSLLREEDQFEAALACYRHVLQIDPFYPFAMGQLLHCQQRCCQWEGIETSINDILSGIDAGKAVSSPFALLAMPSTPSQQRQCAETWAKNKYPAEPVHFRGTVRHPHEKIRLGYFSADFHNHPIAYLTAGLFECHDRDKFEVIGFSFGASPEDEMRQRLSAAFDRFIDVSVQPDREVAMLAQELEIDIAIDLTGFTKRARPKIFALRPAPLQVNFQGYPGTMGVPYMDYLIADETLIPSDHRRHYTEKIVYLPNTYQVNDSSRQISPRHFTRKELGLAENGFVFCGFNNHFKITPDLFDIWMQLLRQVPESVLWLSAGNASANRNLQTEATHRGIAPERLIFAPRMNLLSEHLARHRLADLFLDTFIYNAHTRASDALWAGLPVLTCLGSSFAGRVAASLLKAVGLPELITYSREEYYKFALHLATRPEDLAAIKEKLANNRTTHPLFDTQLFTRHIEAAYTQMWQRYTNALEPDHIFVS